MQLSIIVPAYNEESRIGKMLDLYLKFYTRNTEILIILNNCRDKTLEIVKDYTARYSQILKYLDIKEPILKGGAIKEGFKIAKGDYIGYVDADGATSPEEFAKLIQAAQSYDGAIASRWMPGSKVLNRDSTVRRFLSKLFVLTVKVLFNLPYYDTQCGAKVFRREAINSILKRLTVRDMAFDVELLYLLKKGNYKIKECPTLWIDKVSTAMPSSLKAIKTGFNMFFTLIKLRLKYL